MKDTMKPTHTPGPWMASRLGQRDPLVHSMDGQTVVASILNQSDAPTKPGRLNETDTAFANARLIAAAPELLEVLKAVLTHYAPQSLTADDWVFSGNSQTDAVLRNARAAIARATA